MKNRIGNRKQVSILIKIFLILAGSLVLLTVSSCSGGTKSSWKAVSGVEETELSSGLYDTDNTTAGGVTGELISSRGDGETDGLSEGEGVPESTDTEGTAASVAVHVCGAVPNPDVYYLPEGSRIVDAIRMAGGMLESASDTYLNLAEPVRDGEQIYVPTSEEAEEWIREGITSAASLQVLNGENAASCSTASASGKININTASKEELMTLEGIGETKAEAIIQYRNGHSGFSDIEEIMMVSGIKESSFEKIKDKITV